MGPEKVFWRKARFGAYVFRCRHHVKELTPGLLREAQGRRGSTRSLSDCYFDWLEVGELHQRSTPLLLIGNLQIGLFSGAELRAAPSVANDRSSVDSFRLPVVDPSGAAHGPIAV